MFMRISIGNLIITGGIRLMKEYCQVLFIFFFREDYAETGVVLFLIFRIGLIKSAVLSSGLSTKPLADSFRRNLLQNGNASAFPDFSVSFKT
ncbi:hypothetical protein QMY64_11930 [Phocaeicola dorei]|nr:hypothetical protein QMY64_11930 [Phocaeicola dorei]